MRTIQAHFYLHAFGLHHTNVLFRDEKLTVMSTFRGVQEIEKYAFSLIEAKILDKSPFLSVLSVPNLPMITKEGINADVNNDGYVDLSDVLIVRSAIQHENSYNTDINGDGITNEIDVLLVKAKAMEAIAAAAPPKRRIKLKIWGKLKKE